VERDIGTWNVAVIVAAAPRINRENRDLVGALEDLARVVDRPAERFRLTG
jgi:hypothetical protein